MTFLNPIVLFGLAAAAIPIILHLLNLRKLRTIEFSTLRFLKELQQTKIRKLKLRQLILLILRTLIIIFIVLAFARPTLKGTLFGAINSQARSTLVIILDDTFSMSVSDEYGQRFRQAKEAALRITELLAEGDEAFLIRLSETPNAVINPATHDFGTLRKIISESTISAIYRNMGDAISLSSKLLEQSNNANKEIYIISDRQQTCLLQKFKNNKAPVSFTNQPQLYFVPIGSNPIPNASIDSLSILSTILEKDKPVSIFVSIKNWSSTPLKNYVVSAYLENQKSSQGSVDIEPWGNNTLEITATPQKTGLLRGFVKIEDDAVETDNKRYFTFAIPEKINVGIISQAGNDKRFVNSALSARNIENGSLISAVEILPDKLSFTDLSTIDVLMLLNIPSLSETDCERIKSLVEQGKGLVIFPGPDISLDSYNTVLLPKLGIPPIEKIIGTISEPANLNFQSYDFDHPLFLNMFEKQQPNASLNASTAESPFIVSALSRKADKKSRTIIAMNNGLPALTEHTAGLGKVLFFAIPPTLGWSDFPIKGIFAPIIYRSLIYLSPRETINSSVMVGDEMMIPISKGRINSSTRELSNTAQYMLVAPDSIEEIINRSSIDTLLERPDTQIFLPISGISQCGIYEIRKGSVPLSLIAANPYPPESDPRITSNEEIVSFAEHHGVRPSNIHTTRIGEELKSSVQQTRYGTELWKFCVIAAILLVLMEILIARDSRSKAAES